MIYQFPEHEHMGYAKSWRMKLLAFVAKCLGILIHVDGLPYGADIYAKRSPQCDSGDTQQVM